MRTRSNKSQALLKEMGFEDADLTNKTLLMVALFKKGLTGDVGAIKEITKMMDELDLYNETGQQRHEVTINLVAQGDVYVPSESDEKEIWDTQNTEDWMMDEEEWGTDTYNP